TRVVDQHASDRRLARDARAGVVELQQVAVFDEQNLRLRTAAGEDALGDARVLRELAVLAVHRNEDARLDERQHQLQLFFAAVSRDVHVLDAFVDDVGAAAPTSSTKASST